MPGTVERIAQFKWPEGSGEANADLKRSHVLEAETLRRALLDAVWRIAANGVTRDCIQYASIPESALTVALQAQVGIDAGAVTTRKLANQALTADATGRAKVASEFFTAAKFALRSITLEHMAAAVGAYRIPTGATCWFAGETAPEAWLTCDGSEKLIADYPALAAVLGTHWGVASRGPLWFKLPGQRGQFSRGWASTSTADPDKANRTGGNHVGSTQAAALKSHTHPVKAENYDSIQGGGTGQQGFLLPISSLTWTTLAMPVSETRPKNISFLKIIKT
jgi:microcystin-dependent protein